MPKSIPLVLLIENNTDDIFLVTRAVEKSGVRLSLDTVSDAQAAMSYLTQGMTASPPRGAAKIPNVILLDWSLPGMPGSELLSWMRGQPGIRAIPVVVFTSGITHKEIRRAYDVGASAVAEKPVTLAELQDFIRHLDIMWLSAQA
jgi:CheY-like chemotaxis protein